MGLIIILTILPLLFGGSGYCMGPGVEYYGGGGIGLILLIAILYLLFARGPRVQRTNQTIDRGLTAFARATDYLRPVGQSGLAHRDGFPVADS